MPESLQAAFPRLVAAYREVCAAFEEATKQHDQHGYHYPSPELCGAVSHFHKEYCRASGGDEIKRRAEICAQLTGSETPFAEVMGQLIPAGLEKYAPMVVLKAAHRGYVPKRYHPDAETARAELAGVRRILGPRGDSSLNEKQKSVLRDWERELQLVVEEAEALHSGGCQWLLFLVLCAESLQNGTRTPERPEAKYDESGHPVSVSGQRLTEEAIGLMQGAASSLMEAIVKLEKQGRHGKGDEPDSNGYVEDPADPTAYVPAKEILEKRTPPELLGRQPESKLDFDSDYKHWKAMLDEHPEIRRW